MTGTVLTNNGLALITKLVAAKATLEFSRVAVGTGKVPQGVDPQAMISLNAYKMDAKISSYGVSPDQEDVAYIVTQVSSILSVGPLLCLAILTSHTPGFSVFSL